MTTSRNACGAGGTFVESGVHAYCAYVVIEGGIECPTGFDHRIELLDGVVCADDVNIDIDELPADICDLFVDGCAPRVSSEIDAGPGELDAGPLPTGDAGSDDAGSIDHDTGTGHTCDPAPELCNGMDDDCDGVADNGASASCSLTHATPTCMSGSCSIASCETSYDDCDEDPANGCETNTDSDANNCGHCGNVCPSSECIGGTCTAVPSDLVTFAVGSNNGCVINGDGELYCCGASGAIPADTRTAQHVGVTFPGDSGGIRAEKVALGYGTLYALRSDGALLARGAGDAGALGNGGTSDSSDFVYVHSIFDFVDVGAGVFHACAVRAGGSVYCWGDNQKGQLGDGTTTARYEPVLVTGVSNAVQVRAGENMSCALTGSGSVYCWGDNAVGQLGRGSPGGYFTTAALVTGITNAASISVGDGHACALTEDQEVYCWGANNWGQLGDGTNSHRASPVFTLSGATDIAVGRLHACAATPTGIYCWGGNTDGQLGNGTATDSNIPVAVTGITGGQAVRAGQWSTCGVDNNAELQCWGDNGSWQLGISSTGSHYNTPQPVVVTW